MARVFVNDSTLTDIADAIREKNGTEDTYKPSQMADAVRGIQSGGGYDLPQYMYNFENVFFGADFGEDYTLRLQMDSIMSGLGKTALRYAFRTTNLKEIILSSTKKGIISNFDSICQNSTLERFDFTELDISLTSALNAFNNCINLVTVAGVIKFVDGYCGVSSMFNGCTALRDVTFFERTITKNLSASQSPNLSDASIQSIIDGLADLTGQTAQTLTFHADVKAKLTEEQIATITSKNWTLA